MVTVEEILKIPENRRVYERLKTLLEKKSAMAFVGAGASAPLYPTWGRLIEDLIRLAETHGASKEQTAYWRKNPDKKALQYALQVRNHVGDPVYHQFLYETFKDKKGDDNKPYSVTHGLLMRMNFQAYVTTNYDPGLTQARRFVRPDIIDTGFTMWTQNENFYRWRKAECPILFAHGYYADGKSIVLDQASYQQAYRTDTPYRRLFDNLWLEENLIFVGFSFGDPALEFLAGQVVSQIVRPSGGPPRHIAILPLNEPYTSVMGEEFRETYHTEALFFPVSGGDYSGLQTLLESLASLRAPEPPPFFSENSEGGETGARPGTAVGSISSMSRRVPPARQGDGGAVPPRHRGTFHSCFISYSTADQAFAERIYADLQKNGIQCWFAPEDLKIGERFLDRIGESIRAHDRLLLVLSESAISSEWVEIEVNAAFEEERKRARLADDPSSGTIVLFPIRVDDAFMTTNKAWAADIRRSRHVGDFRTWRNKTSYDRAFSRLLRDLRAV